MVYDGLQAVTVVQHVGDRQVDPAQLTDVARELDGRQGVAAQLRKAPAADTCHVPVRQPQRHLQCLHTTSCLARARNVLLLEK